MSVLNHLITATLPMVPKPIVRWVADPYIAGETVDDLIATVLHLKATGCRTTVDLLGEFVTFEEQADRMALAYHALLDRLVQDGIETGISLKPTALGFLLDPAGCYARIESLVEKAHQHNIFVRLDMEDARCTNGTLDMVSQLRSAGYPEVGCVLQAMLRRTLSDCRRLEDWGIQHVRLCKGIYQEPERIAYREGGKLIKATVNV